ncbi:hypothetical protein PVAG01_00136 [Phlyctema vagabunda]|uniref:Uncharacterized protein n=1 Tax=Phlyctema vagabunda TaxID=108571 RepID=A0ABR4PTD7_9HELO
MNIFDSIVSYIFYCLEPIESAQTAAIVGVILPVALLLFAALVLGVCDWVAPVDTDTAPITPASEIIDMAGLTLPTVIPDEDLETWVAAFNDMANDKIIRIPKDFTNYVNNEWHFSMRKVPHLIELPNSPDEDVIFVYNHDCLRGIAVGRRAAPFPSLHWTADWVAKQLMALFLDQIWKYPYVVPSVLRTNEAIFGSLVARAFAKMLVREDKCTVQTADPNENNTADEAWTEYCRDNFKAVKGIVRDVSDGRWIRGPCGEAKPLNRFSVDTSFTKVGRTGPSRSSMHTTSHIVELLPDGSLDGTYLSYVEPDDLTSNAAATTSKPRIKLKLNYSGGRNQSQEPTHPPRREEQVIDLVRELSPDYAAPKDSLSVDAEARDTGEGTRTQNPASLTQPGESMTEFTFREPGSRRAASPNNLAGPRGEGATTPTRTSAPTHPRSRRFISDSTHPVEQDVKAVPELSDGSTTSGRSTEADLSELVHALNRSLNETSISSDTSVLKYTPDRMKLGRARSGANLVLAAALENWLNTRDLAGTSADTEPPSKREKRTRFIDSPADTSPSGTEERASRVEAAVNNEAGSGCVTPRASTPPKYENSPIEDGEWLDVTTPPQLAPARLGPRKKQATRKLAEPQRKRKKS